MARAYVLVALAGALLAAKGDRCCDPQTPPGPAQDGGSEVPSCQAVCDHWRALRCPVAEPTPEGATCEAVCKNVQESGIIEWDLGCRAHVERCEDIDACEAVK